MDAKRISILASGAVAFVAVVAAGAFVIVSMSPSGQAPLIIPQPGMLIEGVADLKPFQMGTQPSAERQPSPGALTASRQPVATAVETPPPMRPETRVPEVRAKPEPKELMTKSEAAPKAEPKPSHPAASSLQAALPSAQPRPDGLLTPNEIRRMRLSLRLTREQEPYWGPVEQVLLEISAQQGAMVRAGQDPREAFGIGAGMRIYSVARPLLDQLREDQKAQVRARARAMGFGSIASSI